jgi:hypothetical protein
MKYTISEEADKKIDEDVTIISSIITRRVNPRAIVMFGGFGHGCGSFKKIGKKFLPVNDYDMYIILDKKISEAEGELLERECSKAIGRGGKEIVKNFTEKYDINQFFHTDLHFIEFSKLKKMYSTQRTFDLKTSLVVFGDKDILKHIPPIKIPKSDALRLLFNKINHFSIAEGNSEIIKSIYAVKGFTDLCSALLIFEGRYVSSYKEREEIFQSLEFPEELKKFVKKATKAKLYDGYSVDNTEEFFKQSKKWVEWTLKKLLTSYLKIKSEDWKEICRIAYKKLPYFYFNDYLGSKYLFLSQYYLNLKFSLVTGEIRPLLRWRDSGLIIALSMILYFFDEKEESEKYLGKLTGKVHPLKERILNLYSQYYLQKLI